MDSLVVVSAVVVSVVVSVVVCEKLTEKVLFRFLKFLLYKQFGCSLLVRDPGGQEQV